MSQYDNNKCNNCQNKDQETGECKFNLVFKPTCSRRIKVGA